MIRTHLQAVSVVRQYSRVWGTSLPNTIVKNNVVQNCVETGIEGPYELVYHNTVKNTGENSVARYTALQRRYILS